MGVACEWCTPWYLYKAQELQVIGSICVVTEGRTLLVITQDSSSLNIISSLANLGNFMLRQLVDPECHHRSNLLMENVWPFTVSV